MGLDTVELVIEMEEKFGITISDHDAEKIQTVGQCYEYVLARLERAELVDCPSASTFYRLRRALMRQLAVPRAHITRRAQVVALVPWSGRRVAWKMLAEALDMRLPELCRPQWLVALLWTAFGLGCLCLLSGMVDFVLDGQAAFGLAVIWGTLGMVWLTSPLAACVPHQYRTVGRLVGAVAELNQDKLRATKAPRFDRDEAWKMLVTLICEQLAVRPEEVTYDASFVNDLGAG